MPDLTPVTATTATPINPALLGLVTATLTAPPEEQEQAAQDAAREADKALLELARARFQSAATAESDLRREAVIDQEFRALKQWPESIKQQRNLQHKPTLTIDRLGQPIDLTINQQRQSKIGISVSPVDDIADPKTAEVLQGLIRHIEVQSEAEVAYDTGFENAVTFGWGYLRVLAEYVPGSFDQELKITRVFNPLSIYVDPATQEADYSDARYMFVVTDLPKDEFEALYGEEASGSLTEFASEGDRNLSDWMPEGKVRVAEYWWVEDDEQALAQLDLGGGQTRVVPADQVPAGAVVLRQRTERVPKVQWAKITAARVLERGTWVGQTIPIVPVIGKELIVDGKRELRGIVRPARDAQSMYNFWVSTGTEVISVAKRTQVVGAEGQFEGHEAEWQQANLQNLPYLEYKPVTSGGQVVGPPQIQSVEPPIQAVMVALRQADTDLKATTGIFEPSLGERGPQQSGKAIMALQRQGEMMTGNFGDNLARAVRRVGRILLECIPKIYDAPRVLRIIGADDQEKSVQVNTPTMADGVQRVYDLTVGRYDVVVSVGPGYNTRRQQGAESSIQMVQAVPALMQVAGDLIVDMQDWPNAHQISERLKKMLPPNLADQQDGQQPIPPQVQQQVQALMQQHEMLTNLLTQAQEELRTKKLELESREKIAQLQAQTTLAVAQSKVESAEAIALLQAQVQQIAAQVETDRARIEGNLERAHDLELEAVKQQGQITADTQAQAHEAGMTAMQQGAQAREADKGRLFEAHQGAVSRQDAAQEADKGRQFTAEQADANRKAAAKAAAMKPKPAPGGAKR